MENCKKQNVLLCVDFEDFNCNVFNSSACVDGDSMLPESVEEEYVHLRYCLFFCLFVV